MKRLFIFLVGCLLSCALNANAQLFPLLRQATKGTVHSAPKTTKQALLHSPTKVSDLISKNIKNSYQKTIQLQQARPANFSYSYAYGTALPGHKLTGPISLQFVSDLYPLMSELLTSDWQLANYFVLRNNREVNKAERSAQIYMRQLLDALPQLKASQISISHPASQDLRWLTHTIPADTEYLLLGEMHHYPLLQTKIAEFLLHLRQRFQNREIVLLTEFLPEGTVFTPGMDKPNDKDASYNHIWNTAYHSQIQTIGLEPAFLNDMNEDLVIGLFKQQDIWCTLEGIRQRNEYWLKLIEHFRQEHPHALFLIYSGSFHLLYNEPSSVGTTLAAHSKTFMVSFAPGFHAANMPKKFRKILEQELWFKNKKNMMINHPNIYMPTSRFDFANQFLFPQRVLYFNSMYRNLTGFDVQLKLDIAEENRNF